MARQPRTQTEAIERWSVVAIAYAIDRGLIDTTPLTFTRKGWAWMKQRRAGYVHVDDVPPDKGECNV
jgi:hypothetical protein